MPKGDGTRPRGQGPETGKSTRGKGQGGRGLGGGWVGALQKARAVIASPQIAVKRQPISKAAHVMNRNAPSVVLPWPANSSCFYWQKILTQNA